MSVILTENTVVARCFVDGGIHRGKQGLMLDILKKLGVLMDIVRGAYIRIITHLTDYCIRVVFHYVS